MPDEIKLFEELNSDISVNVLKYDIDKNRYYKVYNSIQPRASTKVDLLLLEEDGDRNYVWIKNFDSLFGKCCKYYIRKYACRDCTYIKHHFAKDQCQK